MYLSYSGYKTYLECPLKYWHRYVGKTAVPPDNKVDSLYGSTVGKLFEDFYNEKLWRLGREAAVGQLLKRVDATLELVCNGAIAKERGVLDFSDERTFYKSLEAVKQDVVETVPRGYDIIEYHNLIGHRSDAEVVLDSKIEEFNLGGRADFLVCRKIATPPYDELLLLDGKGSRHRDRYVDADQLLWYSFLHKRKHVILPDRVGFVFWRSSVEDGVDWVPFTAAKVAELRDAAVATARQIEKGQSSNDDTTHATTIFPAKPDSFRCKYCPYLAKCSVGNRYLTVEVPTFDGVEDVGI